MLKGLSQERIYIENIVYQKDGNSQFLKGYAVIADRDFYEALMGLVTNEDGETLVSNETIVRFGKKVFKLVE